VRRVIEKRSVEVFGRVAIQLGFLYES